ncbi:MAG TPA: AraC family transcriptional regulator, partial [Thermoanaerobaculia bacterium]|nr:AraC family transcriptional regulator [Thermoanaerobaculia bacterium]
MTESATISELARLIGVHAPYDGTFELRVPGVYAIRVSRTNTEVTHALQRSSVCIVAQGAKSVMLGGNVYPYEAGQVAVYSVDVPV